MMQTTPSHNNRANSSMENRSHDSMREPQAVLSADLVVQRETNLSASELVDVLDVEEEQGACVAQFIVELCVACKREGAPVVFVLGDRVPLSAHPTVTGAQYAVLRFSPKITVKASELRSALQGLVAPLCRRIALLTRLVDDGVLGTAFRVEVVISFANITVISDATDDLTEFLTEVPEVLN